MDKKIRVGIITILKVNNYGADLQAFALQHKLKLLGFDVEIIDYLYYKNKLHKKTKGSKPLFQFSKIRQLKEFLYPIINAIKMIPYREEKNRKNQRFEQFHKKHTRFSSQTFRTIEDLYKSKLNYDVFLIGSDQVWNPNNYTSLKPYFLTFAPSNKKKISYASSFGVSSLPDSVKDEYKILLNRIDYLSVREQSGVSIIRNVTNRKAELVLDPTLLLTDKEWEPFSVGGRSRDLPEKYLLIYDLRGSDYLIKFALFLSEKFHCSIVCLCNNMEKRPGNSSIINILDAGPREFLSLFRNAYLVVTNSFHGTAFSINFKKPFYTLISSKKDNNNRIENILNMLSIQNRLVIEGTPFEKINFEEIKNSKQYKDLLDKEREKSINFLLNSINQNNIENEINK